MIPEQSVERFATTLDNCDREPIHVPSQIQPHGALLAFDLGGVLRAWSANAGSLLGLELTQGASASALAFADAAIGAALAEMLSEGDANDSAPLQLETRIGAREFDLLLHVHEGRLIAEFELREQAADEVAAFALKAHRAIDRLKRQKTIDALLALAVDEVRALTGFDRVMGYRFRQDGSGEVVAEARRDDLEPYLGRRYPATDIPAQARRLYTLNTLRLIADVDYEPVPVLGRAQDPALDMSHCTLRSVSPIHVEYLNNMGVRSSMSVSIVVNGALRGMLACHHDAPQLVPYSIRMACDVLAQVLASNVQSLIAREEGERAAQAATVRARVMETLLHADDILSALAQHGEDLRQSLQADALLLADLGKLVVVGDVDHDTASAIAASLRTELSELLIRSTRREWPTEAQPLLGKWIGLLGLQFDPATQGWIAALRIEQIETVRWGGRPEKEVKFGPLGPRLTPRGSFAEWRETVRNTTDPWSAVTLDVATALLNEMRRVSNARFVELDRTRTQLLAMLGHDLRDPLQSISMAAAVLERGGQPTRLGQRIQAASTRMQRLVSHVLDMSRLRSGIGLGMRMGSIDLAGLLAELVEESSNTHPGTAYDLNLPPLLTLQADADRIAQVVSNLISNARHHGQPGRPIEIALTQVGETARIEVRNVAQPIDDALVPALFTAFKSQALHNERNRTGLGIGLYIAHEIVSGHGGSMRYEYRAPHVVFVVELPLAGAPP